MGHPAHVRAATERTRIRHRPESTVLYQVMAEHWPAFLVRMQEHGGLPRFVMKEFEEYLRCGRLDHGCLHLVCRQCGNSELVALSCKRRGFYPSCLGRRMADTAVHLEERVLSRVPIRHWICSLPWGLRALLGYDHKLCAEVVSAFMAEVSRSLRSRAKREVGLASMAQAHTGAVVAVQRTESALRLNVHFWRPCTVAQLRTHLADSNEDARAYWLGALLREANTRDVWLFVTPDEVRRMWPRVLRHLGRTREMWAWLLGLAAPQWPPAERDCA